MLAVTNKNQRRDVDQSSRFPTNSRRDFTKSDLGGGLGRRERQYPKCNWHARGSFSISYPRRKFRVFALFIGLRLSPGPMVSRCRLSGRGVGDDGVVTPPISMRKYVFVRAAGAGGEGGGGLVLAVKER